MGKKNLGFLVILEDYFTTYLPFSKCLSPNTIKSYKQTYLLLLNFMYSEKKISADKITFQHLNYDTLLGFFNWLEIERKCKPKTRNQRLSAIAAFPFKKTTAKSRVVFTREKIAVLLALPNDHTEIGLRDKILLSVMYASGARAQEMCDLTVRNVQLYDDTATLILTGKGNKARRIGLPDKCVKMLKKYMQHRHIDTAYDRHIFSSQTHEQMTISCIEGLFKKYISLAKDNHPNLYPLNNYSPHSIRHSTASHLLEAGVDIVTIKNILGHVSLQTTQVYAELSQETVNKRLREWNDTWFGKTNTDNDDKTDANKEKIPSFLKK